MSEELGEDVIDVTPPRPFRPPPHTPQYHRGYCHRQCRIPEIPLPSDAVQCEGWCRAWLQHRADYQKESFADKYMVGTGHERWYYLKTDGWTLSFWDENAYDPVAEEHGHIYPVAWVDMRLVQDVAGRPARGGVEVLMHTRTGRMTFWVHTDDEANRWIQCIMAASVENQMAMFERRREAKDLDFVERSATSGQARVRGKAVRVAEQEEVRETVHVPPYRQQALRQLWKRCLTTVSQGDRPDVFKELFDLYDVNGDQTLQVEELEHLLRELLAVRRGELEKSERRAMSDERQMELAVSDAELKEREEVGKLAEELSKHYNNLLSGSGFRSRAMVLRSALDSSKDGRVCKGEFLRNGPELLLPGKELRREAAYYEKVGRMMEKSARLRGEDESEDEGGCVHQ